MSQMTNTFDASSVFTSSSAAPAKRTDTFTIESSDSESGQTGVLFIIVVEFLSCFPLSISCTVYLLVMSAVAKNVSEAERRQQQQRKRVTLSTETESAATLVPAVEAPLTARASPVDQSNAKFVTAVTAHPELHPDLSDIQMLGANYRKKVSCSYSFTNPLAF